MTGLGRSRLPADPGEARTGRGDRLEQLAAIERELIAALDRDRLLRLVLERVAGLFAGVASGHLREGDRLQP